MPAQDFHIREAARLRSLAASCTTPLVRTRLIGQAVEHERHAKAMMPAGPMNTLRRLAQWHRKCATSLDEPDERQRRLCLAEHIERRADELEAKSLSGLDASD